MTDIEHLLLQMIEFDNGDPARIQHFMKVYEFAHLIGVAEGLSDANQHILDAAAILHDIGIIPCEKQFGHCNGKMQEEYGPAYAMELLAINGTFTEEECDRILFLIAHHHTYNQVDGIDYQILLEADFLVNSHEENMGTKEIMKIRESLFKTSTGIRLLDIQFDIN